MKKFILPFALLLFAAVCASAIATDNLPLVFRHESDTYEPPSGSLVELEGRTLVYKHMVFSAAENKMVVFNVQSVKPSPKQWDEFRKALDAIKVWQWQDNYAAKDILDGGGWSLEIKYTDKQVKSKGMNAYPDVDGKPQPTPGDEPTVTYKRFVAATSKLLGGSKLNWGMDDDYMMRSPLDTIILQDATCKDALDFLRMKGTTALRSLPGNKSAELKFEYRYNTTKPRPPMNYERKSISFATAFMEILQQEGLDYEILGPHRIAITDGPADDGKAK